jgi:hypothetical protein
VFNIGQTSIPNWFILKSWRIPYISAAHESSHDPGQQASQRFWQSALDRLVLKAAGLETVELEQLGDTAYEVGKYTLRGERSNVLGQGKYIVSWKQQGG